jgi:hypothetical protein
MRDTSSKPGASPASATETPWMKSRTPEDVKFDDTYSSKIEGWPQLPDHSVYFTQGGILKAGLMISEDKTGTPMITSREPFVQELYKEKSDNITAWIKEHISNAQFIEV